MHCVCQWDFQCLDLLSEVDSSSHMLAVLVGLQGLVAISQCLRTGLKCRSRECKLLS